MNKFPSGNSVSPVSRPKHKFASRLSHGGKMLAASMAKSEASLSGRFYTTSPPMSRPSINPFRKTTPKRPLAEISSESSLPSRSTTPTFISPNRLANVTSSAPPLIKKRKTSDSPNGIINMGNTCYLNAVLQSLLGLRCFALDIVQSNLGSKVEQDSLFCTLYLLVKCKYNGDSQDSQIILIRKIRRIICSRKNEFSGFNMQDAHELLTICLNLLKTDINHICLKETSSKCPVGINFTSSIEQTLTCTACGNKVTSYEDILELSLHFAKSENILSLQDMMETYFKIEEVDYTCHQCSCKKSKLSRRFSTLPRVLILTLKRYTLDVSTCSFYKSQEPVRINRCLDLSSFSSPNVSLPLPYQNHKDILNPLMGSYVDEVVPISAPLRDKSHLSYRMTSIISHVGSNLSTGHYVSEIYCPINNVWWHCNDSLIIRTTEEKVRQLHQTTAYVLFYIYNN